LNRVRKIEIAIRKMEPAAGYRIALWAGMSDAEVVDHLIRVYFAHHDRCVRPIYHDRRRSVA
jgi:hypothetical protein